MKQSVLPKIKLVITLGRLKLNTYPKEVVPMLDPRQQRGLTNMKQMEKIRKNISKRKAKDRQPRGLFNPLER